MSNLYNMIFGQSPWSSVLLMILNVNREDVPRYRDCFLSPIADEIIIHTRTGGGNREAYKAENQKLRQLPGFKYDMDEKFDNTYANWHYAIPNEYKEMITVLRDLGAENDPAVRWQQVLSDLLDKKTTADTTRAMEIGEIIFKQIKESMGKTNDDGG